MFDTNTALTSTTLALNNGSAVRAKVGARVGTEWISDGLRVEPSLVASAYSDVSVSNGALFVGGGGISLPTDQGKVRGEIQGSVNFFDLRTGWSGFRPGRKPASATTCSRSAGRGACAISGDLPVTAPRPAAAP